MKKSSSFLSDLTVRLSEIMLSIDVTLFVLTMLLSEIMLTLNVAIGLLFYVILITGVLLALHKTESLVNNGKLMTILLILPIIRLIGLFLDIDYFWKTLIVYCALLFLVCFYSFKFKINPGYTKKNLILLPLIVLLGIVMGATGNFLFDFEKTPFLILIPLIAFSEEVLFRGLIQKLIKTEYGGFLSILFTAMLYGILNLSLGFPAVLFIFWVSLFISLFYDITENIFLAIIINMIVQAFIFVLPKL